MFHRTLENKLRDVAKQFPVVTLLGPRQAGKTTLARASFPNHAYISLEDLDNREFAGSDPRGFLATYARNPGVIFDEIQHVPQLLSYIQTDVDRERREGYYILTGSQNLLIGTQVSQSLAGRTSIQTLLPLSIKELVEAGTLPKKLNSLIFRGFYPSIYSSKINVLDWYSSYVRTYVERDVRQMKNIADLSLFQTFIKLCAGRIGQLLNVTSLANDCGISTGTAQGWISLLEASYIIFLLKPYHKNFSKRLVKSPKLYFYDTGIACSLLGMESEEDLATHYLKGGLFESMVLSDLLKQRFSRGLPSNLYFWRDKVGHEVDCLIERSSVLVPIEIKSGMTIASDAFDGLAKWQKLAGKDGGRATVVYGGSELQHREQGDVVGWTHLDEIVTTLL